MAMLDPDPSFFSKTSCVQLGYGIWVNLATLGLGLAHGFPAIQVPQLTRPECEILVTVEDISWIASVTSLSSPVGCIFSGLLMDRYGRKPVVIICELPLCIGWIYTALSGTATNIIIGRVITGIGCGLAMGAPRLYTAEISLANMRGVLGSFPNMFISIGMTLQATMGSFLTWETICFICGVYSGCLFLSYMFLTETPYYLLLRGAEQKARKSLVRFRAKTHNIDAELQELMEFKHDNNIRSLTVKEKLRALFSGSCLRPFAILMMYIVIGTLSGISIVTFWTIELLMVAKSSFDVYAGNVAINVTRLIFGLLSTILLYHVGRRAMAVVSAAGVGTACIMLGFTVLYSNSPSVLPLAILMAYMAFSSLGFLSLPFLFMSELYPLQVRGILMAVSISLTNIFMFLTAKSYPYLRDNFGLSTSFFIFGACTILGALFLYYYLPETKGLTLQEIEEYFNDRRATLVSGRRVLSAQMRATRHQRALRPKPAILYLPKDSTPDPPVSDSVQLPSRAERSSLRTPSLVTGKKTVSFSHPDDSNPDT